MIEAIWILLSLSLSPSLSHPNYFYAPTRVMQLHKLLSLLVLHLPLVSCAVELKLALPNVERLAVGAYSSEWIQARYTM